MKTGTRISRSQPDEKLTSSLPEGSFSAEERIYGFPPIIDSRSRVLVLGSMPGVASLEQQEYYAKPQNAFWRIMAKLYDFDPQLPYPERVQFILRARVAVWDVLASCVRPGSLDSAIRTRTVITNDLVGLLSDYRAIGYVCFNGRKAEDIFRKQLARKVCAVRPEIRYICLPSTSPAMATLDFDAKLGHWRALLDAAAKR